MQEVSASEVAYSISHCAQTVSLWPVGEKEAAFRRGVLRHWGRKKEMLVMLAPGLFGQALGVLIVQAGIWRLIACRNLQNMT